MSKYKPIYRLSYYEDDVVEYTSKGKYPKIPEHYMHCKLFNNRSPLKGFLNKETAYATLKAVCNDSYVLMNNYKIFKCSKCGMYHFMEKRNYYKLIEKDPYCMGPDYKYLNWNIY